MQLDKRLEKVSVSEICFYIFFMLLFWVKGAGFYDGQLIFNLCFVMAVMFWGAKMALTKFSKKEWILLLGTLAISGMVYLNSREKGILLCVMMIFAMKNMNIKKVMRAALWAYYFSFVPMAVLTSVHLIDSPSKIHLRPIFGYMIRWGLGYVHPNVAHVSYFIFSMLIVYMRKEKISWKECTALMAGNIFVFLFTVSQTGFLITSLFLMLIFYKIIRCNFYKWEYVLAVLVLPVSLIISLVFPVVLKGKAFDIVNKLLNTRLNLSRIFLTGGNITLFGKVIETTSNITMDNSFVFAFMTYGIVIFVFLMLGVFALVCSYTKEKKDIELIIVICILIAGITEPFLFNSSFKNIMLLLLGEWLLRKKENEVGIFSRLDKKMNLTIYRISFEKAVKFSKKKDVVKVCFAGGVVAVVSIVIYVMMAKVPSVYIAPRANCQVFEQESIYLTEEDVKNSEDFVRIMDYKDSETEMIEFTGLGTIEYIRGIICCLVYGYAVAVFLLFLLFCGKINKFK